MPFRDVIDIVAQAGNGGDGGLSFLRLKYIPKGGPDGGHGGKGGSVFIEAIDDVTSLDRLIGRRLFKAGTGAQGEGRNCAGTRGDDLTLKVPVGTTAYNKATGEVIADLSEVGQVALLAQGGLGGRGNSSFANSTRQAPRFSESGTLGERFDIRLELRMIADVGLVGYPNAGKSSLLAALSNAKPEIASYPFTTLSPNLGIIEHDMKRFTMADIPGIIEDAHLGKGLGLEFLRHISRTRLLVYVLDISAEPAQTLTSLQHELKEYDDLLLERSAIIALNKIDLADDSEVKQMIADLGEFGLPIIAVSAEESLNLEQLRDTLFALLPEKEVLKPLDVSTSQIRATPPKVSKRVSNEGWLVTGTELEAVVSRFDTKKPEVVAYLQHHFKGAGIYKLLKKAGAQDGDEVVIAGAVFDYFDEEQAKQEVE